MNRQLRRRLLAWIIAAAVVGITSAASGGALLAVWLLVGLIWACVALVRRKRRRKALEARTEALRPMLERLAWEAEIDAQAAAIERL
jgi:hypothetical protein